MITRSYSTKHNDRRDACWWRWPYNIYGAHVHLERIDNFTLMVITLLAVWLALNL